MSRSRLMALLLALMTLLVFLPVGSFSFVNYDDTDYVTENAFVRSGLTWPGVAWAFTAFHAGNWHPLTWLAHMLDCQWFGAMAGAHHFVNVLWHAANVALLFTLIFRLTGALWRGAFIAALFAWHPLHVESVAWIAERKDVLSTFFALLALLSYTRFAQAVTGDKYRVACDGANVSRITHHAARSLWLALVFFALGLLAKPMLVTLPFVMLLLDLWPLNRVRSAACGVRNFKALLVEKIPFFVLTAVSCVVTFLAQKQGEAVMPLTRMPLLFRLENAPVAVAGYLSKCFRPVDLCVIYPLPRHVSALEVASSVVVLLLISAAAWRWRQTKPYLLIGWLWFLGTLVPVIGLVQVGGQSMADRYTYIPSIGLFIAIVFLLADFAVRLAVPKVIATGFAAVILTLCVLLTEGQLQFWRDSETLFRRAVAVTHDNDIALVNLGVALDEQGRFDESLAVYRRAAELQTGRYQIHNNLGNVLDKLGRPAESLAEYREALRLRPGDTHLHSAVGSELAALGQVDAALGEFAEAQRLNPLRATPHLETAKILFQFGRDVVAVQELQVAVRLEPDNFQTLATAARYLAANENATARDPQAALALARQADDLSGHCQPLVFDVLGMACAATGDFTNAQNCAQNALTLAVAAQLNSTNQIRQRLMLYEQLQPWRESFRKQNAP